MKYKKYEILEKIKGKLIISCQALPSEPLYVEDRSIMYLMARAAKKAGSPCIRTNSIRDIIAIKEETSLPVIGIIKIEYEGYDSYITPTMKEIDELVSVDTDIIAPDIDLVKRLSSAIDIPVIAEGKIHYPEQAVQMLESGAYAVVVGGAITRPLEIAQRFINAIEVINNV